MPDEFDFSDLSFGDFCGRIKTPYNATVGFSYSECDNAFTLISPRTAPSTRIILSKRQSSPCVLRGKTLSKRSVFLYLSDNHYIEPAFGYAPISAPFAIGTQLPGNWHVGVDKNDMRGAVFDAISFVGGNLELLIPENGYK